MLNRSSFPENSCFDEMKAKLQKCQQRIFDCIRKSPPKHQLLQELIEKGVKQIINIYKYIDDIKLYVVFMGTMSSGKSTFINSLLGHELLPSRNQECTSQFLLITHHDSYIIDDQPIQDLNEASKYLFELQENGQRFNFVKIQGPSLFHSSLPPDLRKRVVFMDTPGMKLSEKKKIPDQFQQIEDLIGDNFRINVWVNDYIKFDSEKDLVYKQLEVKENEQNIQQQIAQIQYHPDDENNQQQPHTIFFVMNKYDAKTTKDKEINISIFDKAGNKLLIYKVSATDTLYYKIMNSENKQEKDRFLKDYLKINGVKNKQLSSLKKCDKFCKENIKKNPDIIKNQDIQLFEKKLETEIKDQINRKFDAVLLPNCILYITLIEQILSAQSIILNEEISHQLEDFIETLTDEINRKFYLELQQITENHCKDIQQEIYRQSMKLDQSNSERKKMVKTVSEDFMKIFSDLDKQITKKILAYHTQLLVKINKIFNSSEFQYKIIESSQSLFSLSQVQEYSILELSLQEFHNAIQKRLQQSTEIFFKLFGLGDALVSAAVCGLKCYWELHVVGVALTHTVAVGALVSGAALGGGVALGGAYACLQGFAISLLKKCILPKVQNNLQNNY